MIKTIKIKNEMNFIELMEYIIQNDIRDREFTSRGNEYSFSVCEDGIFDFYGVNYNIGEIYEVEVEEEITEDTVFYVLVELLNHNIVSHNASSIRETKNSKSKKFYALIDGELKLVWERNSDE